MIYRAVSFLIIFSLCFVGCQKHAEKIFPPIENLDELELFPVADFTEIPEIASAAMPVISSEGDIFFFDSRLKQLFKSDLSSQKVIPIGRYGEGPGEYTGIMGLLLENDNLYFLDVHRKIVCLDKEGHLIWEEKFTPNLLEYLVKKGKPFTSPR